MPDMMQIGQTIKSRYRVDDLIQQGGQASLAKGVDRKTGDLVTIKQLSAAPGQVNYEPEQERFKRAGQLRINHPTVVDPIDLVHEKGAWYMILPYIEGTDLDKYVLAQGQNLKVDGIITIISEVAEGLEAIHNQGVVHRDLKPSNIIIDPDGHPHIIDLGICKNTHDRTITQGDGLLGTLIWMSPEQIASAAGVDYRSDLYALGAILYFMLTGSAPIQGDEPGRTAVRICQDLPPQPSECRAGIPAHVDAACMTLLAKRAEARFQSAGEFCQALHGPSTPNAASHFCTACGTAVVAGSRYCCQCGMELSTDNSDQLRCLACGTQAASEPVCPSCRLVFSSTDHRLVFAQGPLTGVAFRIPEGIYTVGREQLLPRDQHISRVHLKIACLNGSVHLQDAGSANRTYVAGQAAESPILLHSGQDIRIADNTATYITLSEGSPS